MSQSRRSDRSATVDRWWRENRLAAPELFAQELASAFETIATHPGVGRRYPDVRVVGVRRTVLRACRYHVYYVATDDEVVVLVIDAARMQRDGHTFFLSENGVWLVACVPPEYLRLPDVR